MGSIITEKEYEVHYYEVDCNKNALITAIMNYFGDISTYQSEQRNNGLDYMKDNNIAWVLYKWDISINKFPCYGEKVRVRTIPYSFRRFYAYRKFQILDRYDNIMVDAISIWFLIDAEKRKPIRIPKNMFTVYGLTEKDNKILDTPKLIPTDVTDHEKVFNVRYEDIDTNGHVNNVKYISWIMETVPIEIVTNHRLQRIIVVYEKETKYGEIVKVKAHIEEGRDEVVCKHKVINEEGQELTIAETFWA
ncbi:acyl-[acyl-carrier-protein] thioesterase [Clostridium rectalis]|uniref:acyl-[acyl-carrier-protein] thioesterase n=1 Tax=Clostridium rectalis TaxID=2040295 RepID=UPI000F631023|nr:acyl-ACP thioesterase domain-containing protein [Clostridium rectalis]